MKFIPNIPPNVEDSINIIKYIRDFSSGKHLNNNASINISNMFIVPIASPLKYPLLLLFLPIVKPQYMNNNIINIKLIRDTVLYENKLKCANVVIMNRYIIKEIMNVAILLNIFL